MTDVPRRLRPDPAKRSRTIQTQTHTAHSAQGTTAAARPVRQTNRARPFNAPPSGSSLPRLAVYYSIDDIAGLDSTDKVYVPSWSSEGDDAGGTAIVADSSGIGIYTAGIFAVNLFVHAEGMQSADPTCTIIGFCDYFEPFTESFGCVTRGGDPSSGLLFSSTSRTYYLPNSGSGALQPGLAWINMDAVHIASIFFEVQVQKIA